MPINNTNMYGNSYEIVNRQSGYVLDDISASTTAGTHIQQWPYLGNKNQQWQITQVVYYNIVNRNSGLPLDVVDGSTESGAFIQQWPSNGYQQQQWELIGQANGTYAIMNNLSSKVLDVANSSAADGALIEQNDYKANSSQQWQFVSTPGGNYGPYYFEIKNVNSGKVLDMTGGYVYGGALLQQWDDLKGANQQWQFVPVDH